MGKRSKNSDKAGRGALVRRLRREHRIDEAAARHAAASKNPDLFAERVNDFNRSKAVELTQLSYDALIELRGDNCPPIWSGWCSPDATTRREHNLTNVVRGRTTHSQRRFIGMKLASALRELAIQGGFPGLC